MVTDNEVFMGCPRAKIPWHPTFDYSKCNDCMQCITFCPHGVLSEVEGKVKVTGPLNCVVFCKACGTMCPLEAISFPEKKEVLKIIKANRIE